MGTNVSKKNSSEKVHLSESNDLNTLLQSEHVGLIGPTLIEREAAVLQEWLSSDVKLAIDHASHYSMEPKSSYEEQWKELGIDGRSKECFDKLRGKNTQAQKLLASAAEEGDLYTVMELFKVGIRPINGTKHLPIYMAAIAHLLLHTLYD